MITFLLSFTKEFLMTAKSKLFILKKDKLGTLLKCIGAFLGDIRMALVLGVDITTGVILKTSTATLAMLIATVLAVQIINQYAKKNKKDRIREYNVEVFDITQLDKLQETLSDLNINVRQIGKNLLAITSYTKDQSKIITSTTDNIAITGYSLRIVPIISIINKKGGENNDEEN